jgi:hypothetical protein
MRRIVFSAMARVSLLLCVATIVIWIRSHWISDGVAWLHGSGELGMQTGPGALFCFQNNVAHTSLRVEFDSWPAIHFPDEFQPESILNRIGFGYRSTTDTGPLFHSVAPRSDIVLPRVLNRRIAAIPAWFIAACLAILPIRFAQLAYRRRRRSLGHLCANCGYDLRATPDRCPECGTAVSQPSSRVENSPRWL